MLPVKDKPAPADGLSGFDRPAILITLADWLLPSRTLNRRIWPLTLGAGYVALIACLGGLRSDHVWMGMIPFLDFYNEKSRRFLRYFLPFILTGVIYDFMRYFYWEGIAGHVRVAEPYLRDLAWFGIPSGAGGARVTPNEFFLRHQWRILDLLCGFAYLVYIAEYLLAAFYLFFRENWRLLEAFGWAFFGVNMLGFITYFIYPAAPPWYVSRYGMGPAVMDVHPSAAGAARFDQILGTHFFDGLYGRGVDVFGAYPSLHVAYPFLVAWVCFATPDLRRARPAAILFYLLMCLSAVYLQHHYVVDVLLGTLYASVTIAALLWVDR